MAKEKENAPQQKGPQKGQGDGQPQPQQKKKQPAQAKGAPAPKPAKDEAPAVPPPPPRLREHYRTQVVPDLMKKFGYKTVMQVPRIRKITINMGVGETTTDKKILDHAVADMTKIAGQKPVVTKARKSIANFKVRANFPVGCMVTLRGARMYEFLDRLISIAIPRIRDFRGLPVKFDGRGNYTIGVREQIIFPEIDYDAIDAVRGLDIVFTTSATTDEEGYALLEAFGFPFADRGTRAAEAQAEASAVSEEEREAKHEAEQAALEQLKEENPEAYAKPEPEEGDEEGDATLEDSEKSE
jgi:large subunit ribosomal protein L5